MITVGAYKVEIVWCCIINHIPLIIISSQGPEDLMVSFSLWPCYFLFQLLVSGSFDGRTTVIVSFGLFAVVDLIFFHSSILPCRWFGFLQHYRWKILKFILFFCALVVGEEWWSCGGHPHPNTSIPFLYNMIFNKSNWQIYHFLLNLLLSISPGLNSGKYSISSRLLILTLLS